MQIPSSVSLSSHAIGVAYWDSTVSWSQRFGGANYDSSRSVAVAEDGSVVVTGFFSGIINFGSKQLVSQEGSTDVFVVKLKP